MINNISGRYSMVAHRSPRKHGALSEAEITRRQLMRDVMNRLDYEDIKKSMIKDRKRLNEHPATSEPGALHHDVFTPAADVILPKIEGILMDLRSTEDERTLRMEQIEISLAEICAD